MSQVYEILSSETTSDFVMILILLNLILVLVESVPAAKRRFGEEIFDILETMSVRVFECEAREFLESFHTFMFQLRQKNITHSHMTKTLTPTLEHRCLPLLWNM